MSIDQKLEIILNSVFPKKSNIKLMVAPVPTSKGYFIQLVKKNHIGLEHFYIECSAANRLVEEAYKCEK